MRCKILKLRKSGVAIPKYQARQGAKHEAAGTLSIFERHDEILNRAITIAQFVHFVGQPRQVEQLYDPHILWMRDDRLVLSGFEKAISNGNRTDFAQSWLCELDAEPEFSDREIREMKKGLHR